MSSPLEKFRVGDKVTVHDPVINEGVVTRVGRKYVTVTLEDPPAPGLAMRRPGRRAEVYALPVVVSHRPGDDR
jgi:hypothetical protein